jgi:hypothetical protein
MIAGYRVPMILILRVLTPVEKKIVTIQVLGACLWLVLTLPALGGAKPVMFLLA